MINEVIMPKLGLTMDEGTILSWYKEEGEPVRAGEALLSVETDKVAIDVEAPTNGALLKIVVPEGATVPLGEVLAYIGDPGEAIPEKTSPARDTTAPTKPTAVVKATDTTHAVAPEPIKVSPIARKLAEENKIDLSTIRGSGPQGRIVEADIRAILSAPEKAELPPPPTAEIPFTLHPLSSVQRIVAQRMSESARTIPHFYLSVEINAASLVNLRQELSPEFEDRLGIRLTYTDLLLKSLALTLPEHPLLNAAFHSEVDVKLFGEINLGVAIAAGQGLVVGVIHRADRISLGEIAQARHALASKAQERKLTPQDISGGTFTLTNLGMYNVDDFSPIINPGQSAILAVGAIVERPVSQVGQLVLRPMLHLTLAVDHRVTDGVTGALFLNDLRSVLEAPDTLPK
jgi:pyruvate dehydrogenase E2 component (dihydrolipoamide acetyltransferase)